MLMKRNHLQSIITTVMEQGFTVLGKREWIHWVDQLVKLIWYHCLKKWLHIKPSQSFGDSI